MRTLSMWMLRAILFAIILAVVSRSPATHAQEVGESLVVNVPFAFEDGSQYFPPGLYTIRMEFQNLILIRGDSSAGFLPTIYDDELQPSKTTKIVFRKYGDRYFVREIWVEGDATHTHTPTSKAEKELTSAFAENKTASTGVEVAVLGTLR
jgi:hypothetical protein